MDRVGGCWKFMRRHQTEKQKTVKVLLLVQVNEKSQASACLFPCLMLIRRGCRKCSVCGRGSRRRRMEHLPWWILTLDLLVLPYLVPCRGCWNELCREIMPFKIILSEKRNRFRAIVVVVVLFVRGEVSVAWSGVVWGRKGNRRGNIVVSWRIIGYKKGKKCICFIYRVAVAQLQTWKHGFLA